MSLRGGSLFLLALTFCALSANAGETEAIEFAKKLENSGPFFHGAPLRKTKLIDIDQNGSIEILLTKNAIEEETPGFLNTELYEALAWVDIYSKTSSGYKLSTTKFKEFLKNRRHHYEVWLERIQNFDNLNEDSISLLRENNMLFEATLKKYVELASENGS